MTDSGCESGSYLIDFFTVRRQFHKTLKMHHTSIIVVISYRYLKVGLGQNSLEFHKLTNS